MGGVPMSAGENMFIGVLVCLAFLLWSALMFGAGVNHPPGIHTSQQACEAKRVTTQRVL